MEVYALDATNIDDFDFLVEPSALRAVKREEAHGFCVKTDGAHVGALVGRFTDDKEYEIMSLFVLPEYRKTGVGEKLLETLADVISAQEADVSLSFACISADELELKSFLEKNGFEEYKNTDSHIFSVTIEEIAKSKLLSEKKKANYPCFNDLSKKQLEALDALEGEGFIPKPFGGFTSERVEKDVSIAVFRGDQPTAYAVIERENDDLLILSSLYVNETQNPTAFVRLLSCCFVRLNDKYTEDTVLLLPTVNEESENLFSKFFDEQSELEDVFFTYRKYFPGDQKPGFETGSLSGFMDEQLGLLGETEDEVYLSDGQDETEI